MPTTLTPVVRAELEAANITGTNLKLTRNIPDRKLYEQVDKIIKQAGGKWNRGLQAHVFPSDPRERLGLVLKTGKSVSIQPENQAFYSPPELAARMVGLVGVKGLCVLEPSAGRGALIRAAMEAGARNIEGVEKDEETFSLLGKGILRVSPCQVTIHNEDFLVMKETPIFDRVLMNPPFTKNQDIAHVIHASKFLRPGGALISVMAGNTQREKFEKMIADFQDEFDSEVIRLPINSFRTSGTSVNTILLRLEKLT